MLLVSSLEWNVQRKGWGWVYAFLYAFVNMAVFMVEIGDKDFIRDGHSLEVHQCVIRPQSTVCGAQSW